MKMCSKCKIEQPLTAFHIDRRGKYGRHSLCKKCKKEYQQNNLDIFRRNNIKYEKLNLDRVKLTQKLHAQRNPDKASRAAHARRAKFLGNASYSISKKEMTKLYSSPCIYCGSRNEINADHVIPISRGGSHGIGNLVPACGPCNRKKHNSFIMEWRTRKKY